MGFAQSKDQLRDCNELMNRAAADRVDAVNLVLATDPQAQMQKQVVSAMLFAQNVRVAAAADSRMSHQKDRIYSEQSRV